MVALTERAGALLEQIQTEQSLPRPLRIDLTPDNEAVAMGMSDPSPDDELLYHGETLVLYVSAPASEALAGCTLITEDTPQGTRLAVQPPSETGEQRPGRDSYGPES